MRRTFPAVAVDIGVLVIALAVAVTARGFAIGSWDWVNPDEAEIVAQARAAMISPVPWSTWALGTVGPFLVLSVAMLGWLGFPLTLAFAHLLAGVITGLIGFLLFVIVRREHGRLLAAALVAIAWIPLALVYPMGGSNDFGAFSTELVPSLFLLLAALVPARLLAAHPAWFVLVGVFGTLAVGSKYQAAPLVVALGIARLLALEKPIRTLGRPILFTAIGAALPLAFLGVLLLTPAFDFALLVQNINFVGSYAIATSGGRLTNTLALFAGQPWLLPGVAAAIWLCFRSTRRVALIRATYLVGGFLAVLAGGMGYLHYAVFAVVAIGLALAPRTRAAHQVAVARVGRYVLLGASAAIVVALLIIGTTAPRVVLASPAAVGAALSPTSVVRDPELEELCPPGSDVLVWGWAPELYVHYGWVNTVPYLNPLGTVANRRNTAAAEPTFVRAVDDSDCIVDAVGEPFFGASSYRSLLHYYPRLEAPVDDQYREVSDVLDCEECAVYVRR